MSPQTAVRHPRELAVYERHRADLESAHRGRIVLLHGDELIGPFANLDNAVAAVLDRFGRPEQCLWQEIGMRTDPKPLWGLPEEDTTGATEPAPEIQFAQELVTYERHRAALESEHPGQFAVIHQHEVTAVFEDEQKALAEASRRFGFGKFLLMEIGDPVYSFPNCVLPRTTAD
jgi:hypothetical protein